MLTTNSRQSPLLELLRRNQVDAYEIPEDCPHHPLFRPDYLRSKLARCPDISENGRYSMERRWHFRVVFELFNRSPNFGLFTPLGLADKVGGWDADCEAIGEDLHMYLKCFFALNGNLTTRTVVAPASQTNVVSGLKGPRGNLGIVRPDISRLCDICGDHSIAGML
jgi:hypothetical protein